jgi:hypothetical protein
MVGDDIDWLIAQMILYKGKALTESDTRVLFGGWMSCLDGIKNNINEA